MTRFLPLPLLLAACTPATPAPEEAPAVQPNNATYGTDANLAPSAPDAIWRYADHPRGFAELRLPEGEGPFPLAVIYHGGISAAPHSFVLDKHHHIETGKVFPVCGNTYRMLHDSRFAPYFSFIGDFSQHFGIFQGCGSVLPYDNDNGTANPGACC